VKSFPFGLSLSKPFDKLRANGNDFEGANGSDFEGANGQSCITGSNRYKRLQGRSVFSAGALPARGPTVPRRALSDWGCPVMMAA